MKTSNQTLCCALILLLLFAWEASAAVRYVNVNNPNPVPPYTDWTTSATNIQDAVDAAAPGDQILVTNGVYQSGGRAVGTNLLVNRVAVTKPVTVQSVNGPQVTIIRGQQVSGTTNGDSAIRCVYLGEGALLSGFTLTNGGTRAFLDLRRYDESRGGGVYCATRDSVITNCVFSGNSGHDAGGGCFWGTLENCALIGNSVTSIHDNGAEGGGAHSSTLNHCVLSGNSAYHGGGASYSTLNHCTISSNAGTYGGGTWASLLDASTLSGNSATIGGGAADLDGVVVGITLKNCTLIGNSADYGGGASDCGLSDCIIAENSARGFGGGISGGWLTNCTLSNNTAWCGGGAWMSTLKACTLRGNSASYGGDGDILLIGSGGGAFECGLSNCILADNSALGGYGGGGASTCTLNNCILTGNSASGDSALLLGLGGGAEGSALTNCILTSNSSEAGGGAARCILHNCALSSNLAWAGGGVFFATLNNCTLTENSALNEGGGAVNSELNNCICFWNTAYIGSNYFELNFGPPSVLNYCCTTPLPTNGIGNFTDAPLFVDPANGDFRLRPNSTCINAGDNNYVITSTDLDGNPRVSGGTVDVGAYELVLNQAMLVRQLIMDVEQADLANKNKKPLLATLLAALSAFDRGDTTTALNQLSAFQSKVRAQIQRSNPTLADQLITEAQRIMEVSSAH